MLNVVAHTPSTLQALLEMRSLINILFALPLLTIAIPQSQVQSSPASESLPRFLQEENPATWYPVHEPTTGDITHFLYHIEVGRRFQNRAEVLHCVNEALEWLREGHKSSEPTFKFPPAFISYSETVITIKAPGGRWGPQVYDPSILINFVNAIEGYEVQEFGEVPQHIKFDIIEMPNGYPGGNGMFAPAGGFLGEEVASSLVERDVN